MGYADYVFINVLSTPRNFITGGATGIAGLGVNGPFATRDTGASGRFIHVGSWAYAVSMSREGDYSQTVGSMAHEFGHVFGLPDLYDVEYTGPEDDSAGIGKWGLMGWGAEGWNGDDGPNPFCASSLKQLGWIGQNNDRLAQIEGNASNLTLEDLYDGVASSTSQRNTFVNATPSLKRSAGETNPNVFRGLWFS